MQVQSVPTDTRHRLVEAAGEVFAEQGFRRTTVRQICERAAANIAAVNYHFGDKERLYAAVLMHAHAASFAKYPPMHGIDPGAPPEERLAVLIRNVLLRLFDPEQPAWHGLLLSRELMEPSAALDTLVDSSIRPRYKLLLGVIREVLGPKADDEQVQLCAHSVIGQCLFYQQARHLLARLHPDECYGPDQAERLADHIARFSICALREIGKGRPESCAG